MTVSLISSERGTSLHPENIEGRGVSGIPEEKNPNTFEPSLRCGPKGPTATRPSSNACYYDSKEGCYVTEIPDHVPGRLNDSKPVRIFVPGNELHFAEEGIKKTYQASYAIQHAEGLGTAIGVGTLEQPDGSFLNLILTNRHVVMGEEGFHDQYLLTSLWDGLSYKGDIVGVLSADQPDMALVAIRSETPLATIPVADSREAAIGQTVYAIGNPLGLMGSVTKGIISHSRRENLGGEMLGGDALQFDAAISPGNSGGPVVTPDGSLIALSTFTIPSTPEVPTQNLNFAFPADVGLRLLLEQIGECNLENVA